MCNTYVIARFFDAMQWHFQFLTVSYIRSMEVCENISISFLTTFALIHDSFGSTVSSSVT